MIITSSSETPTGPFCLSFWHEQTLLHRVSTTTAQHLLHWSDEAQLLYTASDGSGPVGAWSLDTHSREAMLQAHTARVEAMLEVPAADELGNWLVTGSADGTMALWSLRTNQLAVNHATGKPRVCVRTPLRLSHA